MKSVSGKAAPRALLRIGCRQVLLASLVTLTACGGRSQDDARSTPGAVSSGGSAYATGGASTTGGGTGGAIADAGSEGSPGLCDLSLLSHTVQFAAIRNGLGQCIMSEDFTASDTYEPWGTVVIDSEGRVAIAGPAQDAAYILADERWPCCANTTFYYWCSVAG